MFIGTSSFHSNLIFSRLEELEAAIDSKKRDIRNYTPKYPIIGLHSPEAANAFKSQTNSANNDASTRRRRSAVDDHPTATSDGILDESMSHTHSDDSSESSSTDIMDAMAEELEDSDEEPIEGDDDDIIDDGDESNFN